VATVVPLLLLAFSLASFGPLRLGELLRRRKWGRFFAAGTLVPGTLGVWTEGLAFVSLMNRQNNSYTENVFMVQVVAILTLMAVGGIYGNI
jgi:hypothetical protein